MSFLRKKVWALGLIAGNAGDGFENNSTYSMFPLVITLTKAGYDNIDKVVQAVFTYLDMLIEQGPNERIFNEIKKIEDLDFNFLTLGQWGYVILVDPNLHMTSI